MNYYIAVLKKYAVFNGRARRREYWMFTLVSALIAIVLSIIGAILGVKNIGRVLTSIYGLATIVPSIAVAVRRLHDTDRSGWWMFIPLIPIVGSIILFVYTVLDSQPGENKYGPNPKGVLANAAPQQ